MITVSRKAESLSNVAAAVYVISEEDMRRSGVTGIADALRVTPRLDVARANARQWAVASRGLRVDPEPHLFIPTTITNGLYGESDGVEVSSVWHPLDF